MRITICLTTAVLLVFAASAPAALSVGDRMLVDVGICWEDPVDYPGYGPVASPAGDGNFWNNFSANPRWGAINLALVDTVNSPTGIVMNMKPWSGCGEGGQVKTLPVSNLYPELAQSDCRWYSIDDSGGHGQPGWIALTGMDPNQVYDIGCYGYVPVGAELVDNGPYPAGTTVYQIGAQQIEIDVMNNVTEIAWFTNVAPDANGDLMIDLFAGTPDTAGAVINVLDINVVPEPASMLLLALGGLAVLRRRKR